MRMPHFYIIYQIRGGITLDVFDQEYKEAQEYTTKLNAVMAKYKPELDAAVAASDTAAMSEAMKKINEEAGPKPAFLQSTVDPIEAHKKRQETIAQAIAFANADKKKDTDGE